MSSVMARPRHFLDLDRIETPALRRILETGAAFKDGRPPHGGARPLAGRCVALIFEKPSTRTRVSFEVGIVELGGHPVMLSASETQLGRGETVADTARVLSRYVDAIVLRTSASAKLEELARHASVPVINGLTDRTHPCQVMADIMTFEEHRGPIAGKIIAWSGDGNNMAASWAQASARFGFELRVACPSPLRPDPAIIAWAGGAGGRILVTEDPLEAVADADCVVTDTWLSMNAEGDNGARERRHNLLAPYQVNEALMACAKPTALFMHCLPAHRGEEVSDGVIDGRRSVVWDEAENRLHVQKGILAWCLE
jgi:ornithine carbamoyltransferase